MSRRLPIALLAATVGLTAAAPAANAAIYMKYEGISGTVTSPGYDKPIQTSASGDARPTDQFSLNFTKISYLRGQAPGRPGVELLDQRLKLEPELRIAGQLHEVHLGLLELARVVPVHRLPARELVEHPDARLAGAVAGLAVAAEREVRLGAARSSC